MSRRVRGAERPPPRLYTLSGEQARLLREAQAKPEGVNLSVCGTPGSGELIDGGAAAVREEHRSGGTRSVHDDRPCEWTDLYLIPTAFGLELLAEHDRREAEEKERKRAADAKRFR